MTIRVNSENRNRNRKIDLSKTDRVARKALKEMGRKDAEVNIIFLSSQKIRVLNRTYFGRDRATDVIAFPAGERGKFLGDIAISSDRAAVNSRIYGVPAMEEAALYVIHGILHLLGYEDATEKGRARIRKKENELLQKTKKLL